MSVALVQRDTAPAVQLEQLATEANAQHQLAKEAIGQAIAHAILAGEALLSAHAQVPHGDWASWLMHNFEGGYTNAGRYMRIARHKALVAGEKLRTLSAAEHFISVATAEDRAARIEAADKRRETARKMRKQGATVAEISRVFGVADNTIRHWLTPTAARRDKQRRDQRKVLAARKALKRAERDKALRVYGGSVSKAYSQTRLLAQTLDEAISLEPTGEARTALREALQKLYLVEDRIVKATGVTVGGRSR